MTAAAGAESGRGGCRVGTRERRWDAAESGDGARAWLYLRHIEAYEAAWMARAALPAAFEPGPFPIRIQTAADMEAARFELLAWTDPHDADGPGSPFWDMEGMVEAVLEPEAAPLVPLVADGGGAPVGLRRPPRQDRRCDDSGSRGLVGGWLQLRARRRSAAQIRAPEPRTRTGVEAPPGVLAGTETSGSDGSHRPAALYRSFHALVMPEISPRGARAPSPALVSSVAGSAAICFSSVREPATCAPSACTRARSPASEV